MKTMILAALLLSSCSYLDRLEEISVPIDQAVPIAQAIADVLAESDLNGDGEIQGSSEWLAFILGIYDAVQEFTDTE